MYRPEMVQGKKNVLPTLSGAGVATSGVHGYLLRESSFSIDSNSLRLLITF